MQWNSGNPINVTKVQTSPPVVVIFLHIYPFFLLLLLISCKSVFVNIYLIEYDTIQSQQQQKSHTSEMFCYREMILTFPNLFREKKKCIKGTTLVVLYNKHFSVFFKPFELIVFLSPLNYILMGATT